MDVHKLSGASFSGGLSGSGDINVDGKVDGLDLDISGAGDINASVMTDSLKVEISGAGEAQLDQLSARDAQVDISGAGDVSLRVTNFLNASISGAGDISYAGNPRRLIKKVSGDGTISAR
jgi:hypothetical protein